ncbi:MAG: hypothetical protein WAT21_05345, partial [Saprospiraceae bacterium]
LCLVQKDPLLLGTTDKIQPNGFVTMALGRRRAIFALKVLYLEPISHKIYEFQFHQLLNLK